MIDYYCTDCGEEFQLDPKKRRCPSCGSIYIELIIEKPSDDDYDGGDL